MDLFESARVPAPISVRPTGKQVAEQGAFSTFVASGSDPKWAMFAFDALVQYAQNHELFATEDLKAWAYLKGLVEPPAPGAWGPVTMRAKKEKIIEFSHMRPSKAPTQHGKPVRVWRSTAAWQSK